ncbi:MAG: alpha/beta fold hydrolase [Pseudomonadota bacterium]|nr:alpha/beta fold hydrolase [Pseudomonadota bacterium]
MMKTLLLAGLCAALVSPVAAQTGGTAPLRKMGALTLENVPEIPPELLESQRRYQNARSAAFQDWLADGSILITTRFGNTAQLHRVVAPGAARTQLTFLEEPVGGAEAQPGTSRFLYSRDVGGAEYYQAYLRGLEGPETLVTVPGTRNQDFVFSEDGSLLAWSQVNRGDPDADIVVMNPADPSSRRVVHQGRGSVSPLDVSPDGRTLLLGRYVSAAESERYLLDLASGRLTEINPSDGRIAYGGGEFTPDGRAVIMTSDEGSDVLRLVRYDLQSGAERVLTPNLRWDVQAFDLSKDGNRLAYVVNEDGFSRLQLDTYRTDRGQWRISPVGMRPPRLPKGVISGVKFSPDGRKLAISLNTPTSAGDVWTLEDGRNLQRWTYSELGGIDPATLVEPELIRYRSFDGRSIPAFVYRPKAAPTGKRPVVIQIHGGPESQELPNFNPRRQGWVNDLGAVVITPNVRGSEGYGKAYLALDNAEKREDSVRDIGALLDWIAAQPDLDPERVAVVGQSYGGYMVLASMAHYAPRLAGGIDLYGISDFATFLQNTEGYRRDLRRAEYGDERDPAMRAVFARIAPINMSARMTKPMMVYQGLNDPRVPKSESDQLVAKLRSQGTEVWYIVADDEGHGVAKKANAEVVRAAETLFLQRLFERPRQAASRP